MGAPGTAELCVDVMTALGSVSNGWCVGDSETGPINGAWDESELAEGRGFDLIVERSSMKIVWISTHGTPAANENLDGQGVLSAVEEAIENAAAAR